MEAPPRPLARAGSALAWLLAVALALPSLLAPHSGDSAIFDYVARAWVAGEWPYTGALDHKPPAVFAVHVLARALSGGAAWGFRALDLAVVLSMAWPLAALLAPGRRGARPLAALLVSAATYVSGSYWLTGQTEPWLAAAGLWGCVWIRRPRLAPAFAAGAALGFAFLMKFTAALFALPVLLAAATGSRARLAARLAAACAGGLAVLAALLLPFALSGRGPALWEATVAFNRYYRSALEVEQLARGAFWLGLAPVFGAAAVAGLSLAIVSAVRASGAEARERRASLAVWLAFGACAAVGVELQGKHLGYHFVVELPFAAGGALLACIELSERLRGRVPPLAPALALVGAAIALQAPPPFAPFGWRPRPYRVQVADALAHVRGALPRRAYLDRFDLMHPSGALAALAERAESRARPGDALCVHGLFAPMAYAYTSMRCPSRFFSDHALGYLIHDPEAARRFAPWLREHRASLRAHPPRFVVGIAGSGCSLESLVGAAYEEVAREGYLALFERAPERRRRC